MKPFSLAFATLVIVSSACAQRQQGPNYRDQYEGYEYNIPMRDGVKLYTIAWVPKALDGKSPMIMERTCYGAGSLQGGPRIRNKWMAEANYIYVYQDVRGKGKSEGDFVNVRPMKTGKEKVDEATDTWDTCEFLVKNVPKNNGNIGLWGISYPGFYAGVGAIHTHPALKAVSPQAPVSNWFIGDDCHHNGALYLQESFDFSTFFDVPRGGQRPVIDREGKSGYQFYLDAGPIADLEKKYYRGLIPYWNEMVSHDTYDQYWKDRSLPDHFKDVHCAVLTVGGFFDKEDMWGALNLYQAGEKYNKTPNFIVMGPWYHGGFTRTGDVLGEVSFGSNTGDYYQEHIEFPFFEKYLNNKNIPAPAEANIFETGANKWHQFDVWPPKNLTPFSLYLGANKMLTSVPDGASSESSYENDPSNPTPYLADYNESRNAPRDWLIYDQRYFETRPDVLTYRSAVLDHDTQIVGKIDANMFIKTTGTDCDLVVKVIDEYPQDSEDVSATDPNKKLGGFQMMVRSDIFRCKFRESFSNPKPITPGEVTKVAFKMNETMHTFKKGHRIMIQVQSDWFPIADRNPNKFCKIQEATAADFQKATISVEQGGKNASFIRFYQMAK
ncbi:MAG: CocE/NonD family hydrolase [Armatimonadetes bacterium]|nr:CocE/NonD family hydrolase [Armatimonadota bacterium]